MGAPGTPNVVGKATTPKVSVVVVGKLGDEEGLVRGAGSGRGVGSGDAPGLVEQPASTPLATVAATATASALNDRVMLSRC